MILVIYRKLMKIYCFFIKFGRNVFILVKEKVYFLVCEVVIFIGKFVVDLKSNVIKYLKFIVKLFVFMVLDIIY